MCTNIEEIYQKIAEKIWSFFPANASCINYYAQIFDENSGYTIDFLVNGKTEWFAFGQTPSLADEVLSMLADIKKFEPFKGQEPWTHCHVSLSNLGKLSIKFAYISEEDSWPNLFMRGISELTEDEVENVYRIPKEIWNQAVINHSKP